MSGESLQLNGHRYSSFHARLNLREHTLTVTSDVPELMRALIRVHGGEHTTFEGEYASDRVVYSLKGGVMKRGNLQTGACTFVFETIR